MITHSITHQSGARSIQIITPCGYEITVMRMADGHLKMLSFFNNEPVSLTNTQMHLSRDGALELSKILQEVYRNA